jgi:hypothetical protein
MASPLAATPTTTPSASTSMTHKSRDDTNNKRKAPAAFEPEHSSRQLPYHVLKVGYESSRDDIVVVSSKEMLDTSPPEMTSSSCPIENSTTKRRRLMDRRFVKPSDYLSSRYSGFAPSTSAPPDAVTVPKPSIPSIEASRESGRSCLDATLASF